MSKSNHLRLYILQIFSMSLLFLALQGCADNLLESEDSPERTSFKTTQQIAAFSATPLSDMAPGETYLGFEGGLYPEASNIPPAEHEAEGIDRALSVEPLDALGNPDPNGKYVLLSIGMSNTTQEFCSKEGVPPCDPGSFMDQAANDVEVDKTSLVIVNGAHGGQSAEEWADPSNLDPIIRRLDNAEVTEAQVQVVWVKVANRGPTVSLPEANADAYTLEERMGIITRNLHARYPNLEQVFFSSRIYAGYATTTLNPEPYAYESGFAVKWLIEAQIEQMSSGIIDAVAGDLNYTTAAPWIGWGAYLWADGLNPRSDGLVWDVADFESDGTHPSALGVEKVGTELLEFFKTSPFTACWFTVDGVCESAQTGTPPTASFTWLASKLQVRFTDGSSDADGQVVSWAWDFGDGSTSAEQNPTHAYANAGVYDVTLTVTDDQGLTAGVSETITLGDSGGDPTISLSAEAVVKNDQRSIRLTWEGAASEQVDIYLDGALNDTTDNDGRHVIRPGNDTQSNFTTQVCEAGTETCSNVVDVAF